MNHGFGYVSSPVFQWAGVIFLAVSGGAVNLNVIYIVSCFCEHTTGGSETPWSGVSLLVTRGNGCWYHKLTWNRERLVSGPEDCCCRSLMEVYDNTSSCRKQRERVRISLSKTYLVLCACWEKACLYVESNHRFLFDEKEPQTPRTFMVIANGFLVYDVTRRREWAVFVVRSLLMVYMLV